MWFEFPVPINLSDDDHLSLPADFLSTTVITEGRAVFGITFPFTRPMVKLVEKSAPWTMKDVLSMMDVLYTLAYDEEDHNRIHEVFTSCTCSNELDDAKFSFSRLDESSCRICLSSRMSTKLILPCEHMFHVRCIRGWFKEQNSCPLCKQPVDPCAKCDSKRTIEYALTDNQLRQLTGAPRVPTQGPFGIGALHYEQLYFSAVFIGPIDQTNVSAVKLRVCAELCR